MLRPLKRRLTRRNLLLRRCVVCKAVCVFALVGSAHAGITHTHTHTHTQTHTHTSMNSWHCVYVCVCTYVCVCLSARGFTFLLVCKSDGASRVARIFRG
jgi:hypothetical protein